MSSRRLDQPIRVARPRVAVANPPRRVGLVVWRGNRRVVRAADLGDRGELTMCEFVQPGPARNLVAVELQYLDETTGEKSFGLRD